MLRVVGRDSARARALWLPEGVAPPGLARSEASPIWGRNSTSSTNSRREQDRCRIRRHHQTLRAYPRLVGFRRRRARASRGRSFAPTLGFTKNGERPFVVLDVDGAERTVWLHHDVLRSAFAREVRRRPDERNPRRGAHRDPPARQEGVGGQPGTELRQLPGGVRGLAGTHRRPRCSGKPPEAAPAAREHGNRLARRPRTTSRSRSFPTSRTYGGHHPRKETLMRRYLDGPHRGRRTRSVVLHRPQLLPGPARTPQAGIKPARTRRVPRVDHGRAERERRSGVTAGGSTGASTTAPSESSTPTGIGSGCTGERW